MLIFLLDFAAERYVEHKYNYVNSEPNIESLITSNQPGNTEGTALAPQSPQLQSDQPESPQQAPEKLPAEKRLSNSDLEKSSVEEGEIEERSFQQQIAAFLILEFGVIFHSVIIGLNLGVAGPEFATLYPVLVFHQSFEGLGIGARMSAIPFPRRYHMLPWFLCMAYGLTTPISIAIGLGLRTTYNSGSFTANVVSGVLDSISAGILIFTGLVELLARDFLFNPEMTRDSKRLTFMVVCVFVGAGIMALLGKWA